ncbi:MAG: MFS transporter [Intrasporangium sp.]|uniref:MFS transporter n=1 Tax=Intrasporangium sp. TaxID=1925024 RepID=UPI0026477F12|nr:MFS transporter [Intrasporangium sp.]MDN5795371.1 MFS transporter [Intrasporangium sp.]
MATRDEDRAAARMERAAGPLSAQYRLVTIAVLALITIIAFEAMAISTAMPVVAADLDAVKSYGLAFSIMLTAELLGTVLSGLWSDRRGPFQVLVVGQLLFAIGCVVAGLAGSFGALLAGRAVAGLGAGLNIVALYVVAGRVYPASVRPRVFSWTSAAWVLPSLVGPPIAGWLTTTFSWRWVFLVVLVPITATFVIVLQQRTALDGALPQESPAPADLAAERRVAWLGLAIALAAGLLQVGAERLVPFSPAMLIATLVGLVGVAIVYPRLSPRGTLRMRRGLPSTMLSRLLLSATFNGAVAFVPLMLVAERGLTPTLAGAVLTVGALGWSLGSWVQGNEAFAEAKPQLVTVGGACLAAGIALLAIVAASDLHWLVLAVGSVLMGLAMGLATSSTSVLTLALSPTEEHGRASSSLNLSDVLGAVLGISLSGAVFAALHDPHGSDVDVFVLMWALLAAIASLVIASGRRTGS